MSGPGGAGLGLAPGERAEKQQIEAVPLGSWLAKLLSNISSVAWRGCWASGGGGRLSSSAGRGRLQSRQNQICRSPSTEVWQSAQAGLASCVSSRMPGSVARVGPTIALSCWKAAAKTGSRGASCGTGRNSRLRGCHCISRVLELAVAQFAKCWRQRIEYLRLPARVSASNWNTQKPPSSAIGLSHTLQWVSPSRARPHELWLCESLLGSFVDLLSRPLSPEVESEVYSFLAPGRNAALLAEPLILIFKWTLKRSAAGCPPSPRSSLPATKISRASHSAICQTSQL